MASGHVNRINRPNTWLHDQSACVKKTLANREPSTHGTTDTSDDDAPELKMTLINLS